MDRINIHQTIQSPMIFEGVYRVGKSRRLITRTGRSYQRVILEDATGIITAYIWQQTDIERLSDCTHLYVRARSRQYNDAYVADISALERTAPDHDQKVATLPNSECRKPESLIELVDLILGIQHGGLHHLLAQVFSQDAIALPFLKLRASLNYHHNWPGGLLEHSVECAHIIQDLSIFTPKDRELGITAALLHDIGKIKTIGADFTRPDIGKAIDHDAITLELCSSALANLDVTYPTLGIDLRHILTCRSMRRWGHEPRHPVAHALQLADRLSSDRTLQKPERSQQYPEGKLQAGGWNQAYQ